MADGQKDADLRESILAWRRRWTSRATFGLLLAAMFSLLLDLRVVGAWLGASLLVLLCTALILSPRSRPPRQRRAAAPGSKTLPIAGERRPSLR